LKQTDQYPVGTPNLFLAALSANARDPLLGKVSVALPVRVSLFKPDVPPFYAHFIAFNMASVVVYVVALIAIFVPASAPLFFMPGQSARLQKCDPAPNSR
jgi:hypothetical protein